MIAGYDQPVPNYIDLISVNKEKGTKYKLGIPNEFFLDQIDHKVIDIFEGFVSSLHEVGISTHAVKLEDTDKIYDAWRAFRLGESAAVHSEWLKTRREEYGNDVLRMLEKGSQVTAVEFIKAQLTRPILKSAFLRSMKGLNGLVVPTSPIPAPLLNEEVVDINGQTLEVYQVLGRLTTVFDVTGLPALNVPAGLVDGKLPVGVQLVGRPFDEGSILSMAHIYEKYHGISQTLVPPIIKESESE